MAWRLHIAWLRGKRVSLQSRVSILKLSSFGKNCTQFFAWQPWHGSVYSFAQCKDGVCCALAQLMLSALFVVCFTYISNPVSGERPNYADTWLVVWASRTFKCLPTTTHPINSFSMENWGHFEKSRRPSDFSREPFLQQEQCAWSDLPRRLALRCSSYTSCTWNSRINMWIDLWIGIWIAWTHEHIMELSWSIDMQIDMQDSPKKAQKMRCFFH